MVDESLNTVLENNFIPAIIMSISAFPRNPTIACHGLKSLQWILEAGGQQVARMLLDEEVMELCRNLLKEQEATEVVRGVCCVVGRVCKQGCRHRLGGSS